MRKFSHILAGIAIILAILACNLPSSNPNQQDPGALMTAAALTVQAKLPATIPPAPVTAPPAQPPTATFTSVPIPTLPPSATPTSNCNAMQFVIDVTIPDGTTMTPGQNFTKTWRLKNVGTCTWTPAYAIVFSSGNSMNGPAVQALTGNVNPGQTIDISANLTAPGSNGNYTGYWRLRDGSGVLFNQFYVQIKVQAAVPPTLPPAAVFAVTNVSFNVTKSCPNNFNFSVTITTNGAGTVNLHRVFSDGGTDTLPKTLVFSGAGSQSIDYGPVYSASSSWTDIYVDSPNHQQFGRASFSCP